MNKNKLLLRLFSDKERFADLINGFAGAPIVHAEDLSELDSVSHVFPNYAEEWHMMDTIDIMNTMDTINTMDMMDTNARENLNNSNDENVIKEQISQKTKKRIQAKGKERYRDLIRRCAYGLNFAIIGIENQSLVHYLMPLRTMSYDVAEYEKQAYLIGQEVKNQKGLYSAEFLSRFRKEDRLHPCITLVLYWGDKWDGPTDLQDILNFENIPPELKRFVNPYPLHLIDINTFENTDSFRTDLKQIFNFIRHSRNGMKLKEIINSDKAFEHMDEAAYDVITAFTHATELTNKKPQPDEGGKINMCEGIRQLIEEGKNEGIFIGRNEGISIGGTAKMKDLISKKLAKGKSISVIADELEETVETINKFIAAM